MERRYETTALASGPDLSKARRRHGPDPKGEARAHLLLVEDEQDLRELVRYNLERDGFRVSAVESGAAALRLIRNEQPDLVILDLMLPGMDGLEVCRTIRSEGDLSKLPIVMLTAKSEEADVVTGLELGADDYVTKPFSSRVLIARIKAVLRRKQAERDGTLNGEEGPGSVSPSIIRVKDVVVDSERHEVRVAGTAVELTATEFRLLALLAGRPGRVFTRQQIIEQIHGKFSAVTDRSVDVQVVSLRRKLGERGADVETVRGVGYRFRD